MNKTASSFLVIATLFLSSIALAGPPFITDDPEPVEYKHIEFYTSSIYAKTTGGETGTLPHFEFNYGAVPNLQLHLIVPMAFSHPNNSSTLYGLGDLELGAKYRFVQESSEVPQVGIFPLVHLPTGDSNRGLGAGYVQGFIPVWIQKSWGPWTSYGGGGYWINPGSDKQNYWQLGWLIQRDLNKVFTLGAEIFYFGQQTNDGRDETGYDIGGYINLSEEHHILFSVGSDISGDTQLNAYLGYQFTWGPPDSGFK